MCSTCSVRSRAKSVTGHSPFGLSLTAALAHLALREFERQFTLRCACGTCLAFTPHGCWQCRLHPRRRGEPSFEKYIVPGASHPTVTHRTCPGRQLLVAQQVTASIAVLQRSKCDKTKTSFAALYYLTLDTPRAAARGTQLIRRSRPGRAFGPVGRDGLSGYPAAR